MTGLPALHESAGEPLHDNERAALIYQHATNGVDQAIAQGLDALLKAHRDDGAAGALVPVA